jgi:hypothetical protein
LAIPAASALLVACYGQAMFGLLPLGRQDPFARLLGVGFSDVARQIESDRVAGKAVAIVTTDYATTAWFAYYTHLPIIQINEDNRWQSAPRASVELLRQPLLYVTEQSRDQYRLVATHFGTLVLLPQITRDRDRVPISHYLVYRVSGLNGPPLGRAP